MNGPQGRASPRLRGGLHRRLFGPCGAWEVSLEGTSELRFAARTDVGRKREHNEDNFLVDRKLQLFIVCDGLGGHHGGEIASAMAVNVTREHLLAHRTVLDRNAGATGERPDVLSLLRDAVTEANARVHERGRLATSGRAMGTTLSLLLLLGGRAYVAHVGDSRVYRMRSGVLSQLTTDHSLFQEVQQGLLALSDSSVDLSTLPARNQITRAVGVQPEVTVDVASFELRPRDRFLVASDGLHGPVDDLTLAATLEGQDAEPAVTRLIDLANAAGGPDNITAIVVDAPEVFETDAASAAATTREALLALRAVESLRPLADSDLARLVELAQRLHALPGERIVTPGEALPGALLLLTGELRAALPGASHDTLAPSSLAASVPAAPSGLAAPGPAAPSGLAAPGPAAPSGLAAPGPAAPSSLAASGPAAPVRAPALLFDEALLGDRPAPLQIAGGPGGAVAVWLPRDALLAGPLGDLALYRKVARAVALGLAQRLTDAATSSGTPGLILGEAGRSTRPLVRPANQIIPPIPPALPSDADAPRTGRTYARPERTSGSASSGLAAPGPSASSGLAAPGPSGPTEPAVPQAAAARPTVRGVPTMPWLPSAMAGGPGGHPPAVPADSDSARRPLRKTVPGLPSSRTHLAFSSEEEATAHEPDRSAQ